MTEDLNDRFVASENIPVATTWAIVVTAEAEVIPGEQEEEE